MIAPIYNDRDDLRIPTDLGGGTLSPSTTTRTVTREPIKTVLDPVYKTASIEPVSYDPTIKVAPIDMTGLSDLFTFESSKSEPVSKSATVQTMAPVSEPAPVQTTAPVSSKITKTVRILDDQGTPVPGVNVFFDQNTGTSTDFNGQTTITGEDGTRKVFITHVGFEPQSFALKDLPASVKLIPGESLAEVIIDAPSKAAATDSKVPKYLFPAIGGLALLLILMSMGKAKPKKVTL